MLELEGVFPVSLELLSIVGIVQDWTQRQGLGR